MVADMSKIFDQKLKEKHSQGNLLSGEDLPFADESPEKQPKDLNKENIPRASDLYKNPSLHKYKTTKTNRETNIDKEKDEDTTKNVPDNERHLSATTHNKINSGPRLRRSESLNKPERTVSPLNVKLKRSESLNKPLKRSDSLTKNEKTESNNNKKLEKTGRRKEYVKQKRKNGMPDRSIKRRHTVGGTKDPDKVTWLDNKYQEEMTSTKENKEKNLRTSSPDLSGTRRERWHFEISLVGPENMVVALRQHLMGGRPQSFPESTVFKVPLESHV